MKVLQSVFIPAFVLTVLLSGCSGAVTSTATEPDPQAPDPAAQLIGSWHRSEIEINSRGQAERNEIVLTLTPNRYVYHVLEYDEDGEFEFSRYYSGGWIASDTTVTTETRWWDSEAGEWGDVKTYVKSYTLNGDELQVDAWNQFDPDEMPQRETYARHPSIPDVTGTWSASWTGTNNGEETHWRYTWVITSSMFRADTVAIRADDGVVVQNWFIAGDVTIDYSLNYIHVKIKEHQLTLEDGEATQDRAWTDHTVRYAFAPTADPKKIALSPPWEEQYFVSEENVWKDRIIYPWGSYSFLAERQN